MSDAPISTVAPSFAKGERNLNSTASHTSTTAAISPEARAQAASDKFLAYDGDCPMCRSTVGLLARYQLVAPEQMRSNHELAGAELESVRGAGIRNQLVVLDRRTGETRSGSDGLLWIVGENPRYRLVARLLGLPILRQALRWGYETISYNRRIISPPGHQIVCDCEPDVTLARRLMLIVPALILASTVLAVFGATVLTTLAGLSVESGVLAMVAASAIGFAALAVLVPVVLRGQNRIDYWGHFSLTLLAGSLLLLPVSVVAPFISPGVLVALACGSIVAAVGLGGLVLRRRAKALGLSGLRAWTGAIAWTVGFVATLGALVLFR
jgi:predicted DCC family thiol-disulfide oxidoreductase YuxK